jgi:stringent starvation protein B
VTSITGIFARENGEGLAFEVERRAEGEAQDARRLNDPPEEQAAPAVPEAPGAPASAGLSSATPARSPDSGGDAIERGEPPPGNPPRGRPSLRVIK